MEQSDLVVALNSFFYFPILKMLMIISALLCADAMATMIDDYQSLGLIKCLAERLRAWLMGGAAAQAGLLEMCVQAD